MILLAAVMLLLPAQVDENVLVLRLEPGAGTEDAVKLVDGYVTAALSKKKGLQITSAADVAQLVELENDKQLAGCDEQSCLAEIADALGARFVVFGQLGKLDDAYVTQLNLYDARKGQALARANTPPTSAKELPAAIDRAVDELVVVLGYALPTETVEKTIAKKENTLYWPGVASLGSGVALAAVGTIPAIWFYTLQADITAARNESALDTAKTKQADAKLANDLFFYAGVPAIVIGATLGIGGAVMMGLE